MLNEQELVHRAGRDRKAFDQLYRIYYPRLFGYVMRTVMNVAAAEDIVADSFLRIIRSMPRFRGEPGRFGPWAYRIATNCMMDHLRRRRRECSVEDLELNYERLAARGLITEPIGARRLEQFENYARLHQAIRRLKPKSQVVIVLHYFEEKSTGEIGRIMGCPAATVRWRLHRARRRLARLLENNEVI
jgi:RNA polymerase sigma-70 factor (ECF subfamily)